MRSPENVLESLKSKACNKSYKYERLYRNLYNPQFYLLAYQRIQAKPGNMTAGTDGKTIDGMGMARINALIEKMRDFSYQPNPARRTYIPKSNGKMLWSSIFVTLMANKIGGLQFGIYRNCQISSRVFHTAVAALPLTKANRSDFE